VHARSAERPNIAVADALGSPSSESRCARLDAEQAPGQRASKSSQQPENGRSDGFTGCTASPGNGVVNLFFDYLFLIAPTQVGIIKKT
jgi:hypothetical protein